MFPKCAKACSFVVINVTSLRVLVILFWGLCVGYTNNQQCGFWYNHLTHDISVLIYILVSICAIVYDVYAFVNDQQFD